MISRPRPATGHARTTFLARATVFAGPTTRVLFIGNSFTAHNDVPSTVVALAGANGTRLSVEVIATGGYFLSEHASDPGVDAAIRSGDYDVVVLQEQSIAPADEAMRQGRTPPAVRRLNVIAEAAGARAILYQTWGHENGNPISGHSSYSAMQQALVNGYGVLGAETGADVAPVGVAWSRVRSSLPNVLLYEPDGYHANVNGSYLAALVLTSTIINDPICRTGWL